jgi:hypothetical protein
MPKIGWTSKSPQEKGRQAEPRIAKSRGARPHPRSGAGRIKWDASSESEVLEIKHVQKSHTLNGAYLDALYRRATQQGKAAVYVIEFTDAKIEATITITRS